MEIMDNSELLKTIDARIAETERQLNFLHEQRREIINRSNLNKNGSNVVVSKFLSTSYR